MRHLLVGFIFMSALVESVCGLTPADLSRVKFEQHPGRQLSRDLVFRDENDQPFRLGDHFGQCPTVLVLGYYRCPMLCPLINDGLIKALQELPLNVGRDFQVIDVSIDPGEKPLAATSKKSQYVRSYGRAGASEGWHSLVGDEDSIRELGDEVGYRFVYDPQAQQYAPPSGVIVLTPDGKISRYVFGVNFKAQDLQDALAAAKDGRSSSVISQLFLLCYHYNPITGKYSTSILAILRLGSLGFLAAAGWWIISMSRTGKGIS